MWIGVGPIPRSAAIIDMPVVKEEIGLKYGEICVSVLRWCVVYIVYTVFEIV